MMVLLKPKLSIKRRKKMEKFEDLLAELNEVVKELESGTLSLEESIQKYEKGIELSKKCKDKLLAAKEVVIAKTADKEEK